MHSSRQSNTWIWVTLALAGFFVFAIVPDFYKKSLEKELQPTFIEYSQVTPKKHKLEYMRADLIRGYEKERELQTRLYNLSIWYIPINCKSQFRNVLARSESSPWSDPQLRVSCWWFGPKKWEE